MAKHKEGRRGFVLYLFVGLPGSAGFAVTSLSFQGAPLSLSPSRRASRAGRACQRQTTEFRLKLLRYFSFPAAGTQVFEAKTPTRCFGRNGA